MHGDSINTSYSAYSYILGAIQNALIIEDNEGDVVLFREVLQGSMLKDTRIYAAGSLSGGIELLKEFPVDIIFFDLGLPDNFGLEGILSLSEIKPSVPIIIMTGNDDLDLSLDALELGAQDYIVKSELNEKTLERSVMYALQRKKSEEQIIKSEKDYRFLFDHSPIPMFMFDDEDLNILKVNDAAVKLYGYNQEEFLELNIKDLRPADEIEKLMSALEIQRSSNTDYYNTGIWRHKRKNGSTIFVDLFISRIQNGNRFARLVAIYDVTEQQLAKKKISIMYETSVDLIYISNLDQTSWQLNRIWSQKLGYKEDELSRMHLIDLIHPDDRHLMADALTEAIHTNKSVFAFESRLMTSNGKVLYISWNAQFDPENDILFAVGRDTTDKRKEEEIRRLLESVVKNTSEAVIITESQYRKNEGNRIIYVNDALCRLTGYSKDEIIGKTPKLFQGVKTNRKELDRIRQHLDRLKPVESDLVNYRKDGSEYWVNLNIVPVPDSSGRFTHFVSMQKEITERKLTELERKKEKKLLEKLVKKRTAQLEEVNRDLEAFNYSVSHDLRTPLRAMEIYSGILEAELSDPEHLGNLQQMIKCITEMRNLINDLLEFSKMGKTPLNKEWVNMSELISEVYNNQLITENSPSARLKAETTPEVFADKALIKIVLNNLLSNAIKYSSHRELPLIRIDAEEQEDNIIYKISDNGIGFDQKNIRNLFKPFSRLHNNENYKGNGAGLAIVHKIISRHHGKIWAEGVPDIGATFYISLPKPPK